METQSKRLAPRPVGNGIARVIYNVVQDAGKPMGRDEIWDAMPPELHKPYRKIKTFKAITNMSYRGFLRNTAPKNSKYGSYVINDLDDYERKIARVRKIAAKAKNKAAKKVAKKAAKSAAKTNGKATDQWSGKEPVLARIDKRINVLQHKLTELKAMRDLFVEADL